MPTSPYIKVEEYSKSIIECDMFVVCIVLLKSKCALKFCSFFLSISCVILDIDFTCTL